MSRSLRGTIWRPRANPCRVIPFVLVLAGCPAFLLIPARPAQAEPPAGDALDRALRAIRMSRQDLTIDAGYRRRDPFALRRVDDLMRTPLRIPDCGQQLGEEMAATRSVREAIARAAAWLEAPLADSTRPPSAGSGQPASTAASAGETPRRRSTSPAAWEKKIRRGLPADVASEVCALVAAAAACSRQFDRAYEGMTDAERRLLFDEKDAGRRSRYPLHEYFFRHHRGEENVEEANKAFLSAAQRFRLEPAFEAAASWSGAVEKAKEALKAWRRGQKEVARDIRIDLETPAGRLIVGGGGDDLHPDGAAILVDLGGNDTYLGPVAAGRGCTAAIDLAGDDHYSPTADRALGAGIHGVGVFFDCEGDDHYRTQDMALGVGLFGVGIAVDEAGRDEYDAQEIACGVAALGIGMLIDLAGHDTYTVRRMGQAAAVTRGFGLLLDREGNDAYFAGRRYPGWSSTQEFSVSAAQGFAGGVREYTSGGIALLLDLGGDDAYWGEAIAQGVGYWFALGLLIDADGNDFYHARHYSQGCAFHFAVGGLLDNGGNDAYLGSVTCQGSGYDYSAGVLVDYGGDDLYRSDHLSSGSGGVTGMGVLVDLSGSDHYLTGRPGSLSLGGGQFQERRGFGCIGVFLDLGGGDRYAFAPAANQALWTRPEDGVGLDTDSAPSPFTRRMTVPGWPQPPASASLQPQPGDTAQPAAAPEQEVQAALDLLANPYGPAEKRAAAAELIKKYPDLAEPRLIRFLLAEPFYLSFQAAYEAIPKVGVPMIPSLVQVYRTGDAEDRMRALNMLGRIDDPRSVETVLAGLEDESYLVRGTAAQALGRLGRADAVPRILPLLKDSHHTCRGWAVSALGMVKDASAASALVEALQDTHYSVRSMAARALVEIGSPAAEPLRTALKSPEGLLRSLALETLAKILKAEAKDVVLQGLVDPDWLVRASACRVAATIKAPEAAELLKKLAENDPDAHVRTVAAEAAASFIP
ncbi:MAG: HEAT repeat domain-containing protein [Planctomycetes bacterium]|nr:HEAT repeat domain-containing protein [Planctomycetota bacterium]